MGELRIKLEGKFGHWLGKKLRDHDVAVHDLADDIISSPRTIYNHLTGRQKPTFMYIVTYCWYFETYFADGDDPIEVLRLVEEE